MGVLADLGIHKLDLIQFLLHRKVVEITCKLETLDKTGPDGNPINVDDNAFDKVACIIYSMTEQERKHPELIDRDYKRRERIARGSGRSIQEVNRLRQSMDQMKKTMKQMNGMSETDMRRMQSQMQNGNMGGMMQPKYHKGKGKGKGNFRY